MIQKHTNVRPLDDAEIGDALQLAWRVFCEFESPDYAPEGTEEFKRCRRGTLLWRIR